MCRLFSRLNFCCVKLFNKWFKISRGNSRRCYLKRVFWFLDYWGLGRGMEMFVKRDLWWFSLNVCKCYDEIGINWLNLLGM